MGPKLHNLLPAHTMKSSTEKHFKEELQAWFMARPFHKLEELITCTIPYTFTVIMTPLKWKMGFIRLRLLFNVIVLRCLHKNDRTINHCSQQQLKLVSKVVSNNLHNQCLETLFPYDLAATYWNSPGIQSDNKKYADIPIS